MLSIRKVPPLLLAETRPPPSLLPRLPAAPTSPSHCRRH
nr:MAG TPA: hypothetical protein [Caudoviricetes sp.]